MSNRSHDLLVTVPVVRSLLQPMSAPPQGQPPAQRNVRGTSGEEVAPRLWERFFWIRGPALNSQKQKDTRTLPIPQQKQCLWGTGLPENAHFELTKT